MRRFLPFLVLLLPYAALVVFESDYLWTAQEQNLFLDTPLFFQQCMQVSGGLLSWTGAYFTQFFYYPALGAALLCMMWAMLMWMMKQTFHIPRQMVWMTLIPIVMLLLTDVDLGYWIYFIKLRGHLFVATLGILVATALLWIYLRLPRRFYITTSFIVLSTLISYPLFGFYGLLATLLMGVSSLGHSSAGSRSGKVIHSVAALLSVLLIPLICYSTLYHQTPLSNIYWTALPVFVHNGIADTWKNLPYVIIVLWLTIFAACRIPKERRRERLVSALGYLCLLAVSFLGWYKDDNFHRQLTMSRQMEQQDWEGMLATIQDSKGEPTRAMSMMKNLALQRLGRVSNDIYNYPDGFARPDAIFPVHSVHTIGKMLYLQYGIPNYCYRWCMEDGVEYGWSVEKLKLMAKCSLLNGESAAALRYLSLLRKTSFHSQWARKYEDYVRQPSLIAQDAEFQGIFPLLRNDDFLTSDQSQLEPFLIEHLASSPGDTPQQSELRNVYFRFYLNRNKYVEQ
ncbi:MAG: DUF6057 family protein [Prevotella sp.]|nr:DUF6057 family protein [Prevotella sp.]